MQNKLYEESQTDRTPNTDDISNGKHDADEEDDDSMDVMNIIRYGSEVATLAGVLSYVVFQQGDEIKNQGLNAFLKQLVRYCIFFLNLLTFIHFVKFSGSCTCQSHIFDIKHHDTRMHTISHNGRY